MNLPLYKAIFDETSEMEIISLVENPAIGINWIALSKQNELQKELKFNEEKRLITGPALIPNLKIYRFDEELGEYNIYFDEETIRKMGQAFINKGTGISRTTLNHETKSKGLELSELWFKTSESDKSNDLYESEFPIGTMFVTYHITKEDLWKDIKIGKYKGFSIETLISLKVIDDFRPKQTLSNHNKDENILLQNEIFNLIWDIYEK